ncbi:hypothetical protein [Synechocystis sp. PCC 7509]|uniref:hypothetical protein n=1 Tax=Synechocystis sp. PCC 7509 TaxID=927677 RepID=UPI0002AC64CF|nr:hypothetical protein [Synechocystis sp. PCC 7509]
METSIYSLAWLGLRIKSKCGDDVYELIYSLDTNLKQVQQVSTSLNSVKLTISCEQIDLFAIEVIKLRLLHGAKNLTNSICAELTQTIVASFDRCMVIERLSSKASINSKKGIFKSFAILRKVSSVGDIPPLNHLDQLLICIPVRCLRSLYESCKNFSLLTDSHTYIWLTAILACVIVFTNSCVILITNITQAIKYWFTPRYFVS